MSGELLRSPNRFERLARSLEVGEWVSAGSQVVELVDLASVLVRVDAPESAMPFLKVGGAARVWVDALERSFDGRVRHVIPQADRNARTFPVEVEVANEERVLSAGMFARVTLTGGPSEPIVAVPKDAIVERAGIVYVATVTPGPSGGSVGMLLSVTVGVDVGDWIAVTSGNVAVGTPVITRGNEGIMPFPTPVQIVDDIGSPVAMPTLPASGRGESAARPSPAAKEGA